MSHFYCLCLSALLCAHFNTAAQSFQVVFPGLGGTELLDSLASHFRPNMVLDYGNARDTLYGAVLTADDDTLRCIYSGHALYLAPTQDPTQYVYQNGGPNGMNTEHAYPQAKGAANGNARSDMHHLFPARIPVNEARGSLPYGESPDQQTEKWFYKDQTLTNTPATNKNAYTEYQSQLFEPRESVKGDIARAVLYFYTIYRNQADAADPNFFAAQRPTLCQWQAQDPADQAELTKTWRIAAYQEHKPNPYILDCTLAFRTFCPEVPSNCTIGTTAPASVPVFAVRAVPQPFLTQTRIEMILPFAGQVQGCVRLPTGQALAYFAQAEVPPGVFNWPLALDAGNWPALAFLEIHLTGKNGQRVSKVLPLISF